MRAYHFGTVFKGLDPAYVDAYRGVIFKSLTAGCSFGAAEHNADFIAQLIYENNDTVGAGNGAVELSQSLRHKAGLKSHVAVAHTSLYFGLGHKRRNRVDHHNVDGTRTHESLGDFKGRPRPHRAGKQAANQCLFREPRRKPGRERAQRR